jgi:hypothetical protein
MILMNSAPASASDATVFRKVYVEKLGADMDRQREIVAGAAYQRGDPEAVAARYRIHFKPALARSEDYEKLMPDAENKNVVVGHCADCHTLRWIASARKTPQKHPLRVLREDLGLTMLAEGAGVSVHSRRAPRPLAPQFRTPASPRLRTLLYLECAGDVRKALDDSPPLTRRLRSGPMCRRKERIWHRQGIRSFGSFHGTCSLRPSARASRLHRDGAGCAGMRPGIAGVWQLPRNASSR